MPVVLLVVSFGYAGNSAAQRGFGTMGWISVLDRGITPPPSPGRPEGGALTWSPNSPPVAGSCGPGRATSGRLGPSRYRRRGAAGAVRRRPVTVGRFTSPRAGASIEGMAYKIVQARREDWEKLRELRLAALRDPVAPLAFFETYQEALNLSRDDWEQRASGERERIVTFAGETADGRWGGMLSAFTTSLCARVISVYMLPEHRGTGLAGELMRTVVAWAGGMEVRLYCHEHNERAARFYARLGFRPTGRFDPDPNNPALKSYELALRPA